MSLQGKGLIERLSKTASLDERPVRGALADLARQGWLSGVNENGLPYGNVYPRVARPAVPDPVTLIKWRELIHRCDLSISDADALLPLHDRVRDLSPDDQQALVRCLLHLREQQANHYGEPSFMVSARYLMGSSKILDSLPSAALRQFGIHLDRFSKGQPVLLIAGPSSPENVVLIENPHCFWRAIGSEAITTTAFVVTFGYGLSMHGEEYGNQLASILENSSAITGAVCAGSPPPVSLLLQHHRISFWGDLDIEGLRIYGRIKKMIPALELSALYYPMLEAVKHPESSHPYAEFALKHKQIQRNSEERIGIVGVLQEACLLRAVDQEIVPINDICKFARVSLHELFPL